MSGVVVWLTGLPSSGKSTMAARLRTRLRAAGRACVVLDGDEVRAALLPTPGYGAASRDAFYVTLGRLAALCAAQDLVAIVSATAHRRAHRDAARRLAQRWIEVFIDAPLEACVERDAKGLWAAALSGSVRGLPGVDVLYERPDAPTITAAGGLDDRALDEVVRRVTDG